VLYALGTIFTLLLTAAAVRSLGPGLLWQPDLGIHRILGASGNDLVVSQTARSGLFDFQLLSIAGAR
jgi:hypothetical protein